MDQTITSPVQIFINGKFYCVADSVDIKRNSPEFRKNLIPDNLKVDSSQFTGMVININKVERVPGEKEELRKEQSENEFDALYNKMIDARDNTELHIPII